MLNSRGYVRGVHPEALCVTDESERVDTFTVQVQGQLLCDPGVYLTAGEAWDVAADALRGEDTEALMGAG